jgi:hypothetical protein
VVLRQIKDDLGARFKKDILQPRSKLMLKYFSALGAVGLALGVTIASPQVATAAAACTVPATQNPIAVSGIVVQVGKEPGLFQHMVVQDDKTNCRVLVLVETNDKPCAYLGRASITIPVAAATAADKGTYGKIDLMDKGQNEMFDCK